MNRTYIVQRTNNPPHTRHVHFDNNAAVHQLNSANLYFHNSLTGSSLSSSNHTIQANQPPYRQDYVRPENTADCYMNQRTNYPSKNALLENFQPIIRVENQPFKVLRLC